MFTVPKESYVFQYKSGLLEKCYLLLTPRDYMGNSYVLGNIFLNNYYAIYDLDKTRVGLVVAKTSERGRIEKAIHLGWTTNTVNMMVRDALSNKYV
jgi:hypothetical protein